jgi:hypothetical protein
MFGNYRVEPNKAGRSITTTILREGVMSNKAMASLEQTGGSVIGHGKYAGCAICRC